jgi:hypothetical protein
MKHVGKMKNNDAKVVIAYRTLPGDPYSALVIGTNNLGASYHDSLMSVVEDSRAQQANELADVLAVRKFPDGSNMLEFFHKNGLLRKVPTNGVLVTPTRNDSVPLDELNKIIAEQKGISIDELAVSDGSTPVKNSVKNDPARTTSQSVSGDIEVPNVDVVVEETLTPADMRSKADKLFKEAQALRKQADSIDPPKSKVKKVSAEA